jgi:hypothetical protein
MTSQATSDDQLVTLWLHGRSSSTARAYAADAAAFLAYVRKPLRSVTCRALPIMWRASPPPRRLASCPP